MLALEENAQLSIPIFPFLETEMVSERLNDWVSHPAS